MDEKNSFEVEGTASVSDSTISINGIPFETNANTYFDDRLTLASIDGEKVELEGVEIKGEQGAITYTVKEVELADNDQEIDLKGTVTTDNALFGYVVGDDSVTLTENTYTDISDCKVDD
ncbi:hypothetical protein HC723_15290 [Vibrio sp. S11_S32]|uniref:hypothetical protein n=1 Tax=Vibrio sp. S11_S32 TaxID=2720225 RepID=UPI001680D062|nr:hypothetical protein [Vibrio sp. S11_S32]MBD1577767.1 hypothetical protein [Vibrio sp. S11_S32]